MTQAIQLEGGVVVVVAESDEVQILAVEDDSSVVIEDSEADILVDQSNEVVITTDVQLIPGPQGPQGPPGPSGAAGFSFTQGSPSTTWTINHNLGFYPVCEVFSVGGLFVEVEAINLSLNTVQLNFNSAVAGTARLV